RAEWDTLASLLATVPQPWSLMLGNHETMKRGRERADDMLHAMGLPTAPVRTTDLPGLRIVLVETAVDDRGHGRVRDIAAGANPAIMVTSGHSHRHRKRLIDGVPHVEVGSVKDYPGGWAGYVVHEGGLRQVVRRVSPSDCLQWTDKTRWVMFGTWQAFAPGTL